MCHEVWVKETKSTRIGQTVFFMHKYLMQPHMTDTDALIQAGDQLKSALQGAEPESEAMKKAVNALVKIFNARATAEQSTTDNRRMQRSKALQQRVTTEDAQHQRVPNVTQDDGP